MSTRQPASATTNRSSQQRSNQQIRAPETIGGCTRPEGNTIAGLVAEQLEHAHHTLRLQFDQVLDLLSQFPDKSVEGRAVAPSEDGKLQSILAMKAPVQETAAPLTPRSGTCTALRSPRPSHPEGHAPQMLLEKPEEHQLLRTTTKDTQATRQSKGFAEEGATRQSKGPTEEDKNNLHHQSYELLDIWKKKRTKASMSHSCDRELDLDVVMPQAEDMNEEDLVNVNKNEARGLCKHIIMNPNDPKRTAWDLGSMFLVLYDMVMIPFGFFDPEQNLFFSIMEWITRLFWSCDMPMSFISGYVTNDGAIEMRPGRIARKYAKTWLTLDILVVSVDWLEIIMASVAASLGFARLGKASRIFRILRLLRLLRLAKVGEIISIISEKLPSEKVVILIDILKLIVIMLGLGHLLACIWYALGKEGPESKNWLVKYEFADEPLEYRYIMSLRWAISQFAGGMDEVTPTSISEHMYGAAVYMWAFWSGNVFLSILTSHMTQLYILGNQQSQQLNVMRRYLATNGISKALALRVTRNAQHAMRLRQRSAPESAVGLVDFVSEPLRIELHFEMFYPFLGYHSFFVDYYKNSPHVVRKICHAAMSGSSNSMGDTLFHFGEASTKMMIVKSGGLRYVWGTGDVELVNVGNWVSEACLWTHWSHRGTLTAVKDSTIFNLSAEEFHNIVSQFELATFDPGEYAERFLISLNQTSETVTDLPLVSSGGWRREDSSNEKKRQSVWLNPQHPTRAGSMDQQSMGSMNMPVPFAPASVNSLLAETSQEVGPLLLPSKDESATSEAVTSLPQVVNNFTDADEEIEVVTDVRRAVNNAADGDSSTASSTRQGAGSTRQAW